MATSNLTKLVPSPVEHLLAHASGSAEQLRLGLSAVLFLAATEDAPLVDAALVSRALHANRPGQARAAPMAARRANWLLPTVFGVTVTGVLLALAIFGTRKPPAAAPAPVIRLIADAPLAVPPRPVSVPLKPPPAIAVAAPPVREPAPMPPPITIRELPVPAAVPSVLLLFPAHSPRALPRLRMLALALQKAGITDIRAKASAVEPARQAVSYFHGDDAALAQQVATTLASAHWPHMNTQSLQPSLVVLPPGLPERPPGDIEVALP
jgi:hypothetical protein